MVVFCVSCVLETMDTRGSFGGATHVCLLGSCSPIQNSCLRFRTTWSRALSFPHTRKVPRFPLLSPHTPCNVRWSDLIALNDKLICITTSELSWSSKENRHMSALQTHVCTSFETTTCDDVVMKCLGMWDYLPVVCTEPPPLDTIDLLETSLASSPGSPEEEYCWVLGYEGMSIRWALEIDISCFTVTDPLPKVKHTHTISDRKLFLTRFQLSFSSCCISRLGKGFSALHFKIFWGAFIEALKRKGLNAMTALSKFLVLLALYFGK